MSYWQSSQSPLHAVFTKLRHLLVLVALLAGPLASGQTMILYGLPARSAFDSYLVTYELKFVDFESIALGSINLNLQPTLGVTFFSTISTFGVPISSPHNAYLSGASVNGDTSHKLVGTPYVNGSDDGRVGYEIRFDTPQNIAGVERNWNTGAVTNFYNSSGSLLASHTNTTGIEFVGYIGNFNDPATWVAKIQLDTNQPSNARQVGYTDDLIFGIAAIPEPATYVLHAAGLGLLWFSRKLLPR